MIRSQFSRFSFPRPRHPDERPAALQPLAVQAELQLALLQAFVRIVERLPGAAVPQHDGAAAILALRDGAFEAAIFERVVLGVDGEPLLRRIEARPARHRPAFQDAVELKPEIVVEARRGVLLDDKAVAAPFLATLPRGSAVLVKSRLRRYSTRLSGGLPRHRLSRFARLARGRCSRAFSPALSASRAAFAARGCEAALDALRALAFKAALQRRHQVDDVVAGRTAPLPPARPSAPLPLTRWSISSRSACA